MNYRYSEPEGKLTLTPVNPYRNENTEKSSYLKFKTNNPPLIYDGKLKLEVGKVYQGEMFVKQGQRLNALKRPKSWYNISEDKYNEYQNYLYVETRQVLTDVDMLDTSVKDVKEGEVKHVCCGMLTNPDTGKREKGGEIHDLCGWECQPIEVTAPVNQEEPTEFQLFVLMCEGIIFPLAGNLTVSLLYEQFKQQGYKITKA